MEFLLCILPRSPHQTVFITSNFHHFSHPRFQQTFCSFQIIVLKKLWLVELCLNIYWDVIWSLGNHHFLPKKFHSPISGVFSSPWWLFFSLLQCRHSISLSLNTEARLILTGSFQPKTVIAFQRDSKWHFFFNYDVTMYIRIEVHQKFLVKAQDILQSHSLAWLQGLASDDRSNSTESYVTIRIKLEF